MENLNVILSIAATAVGLLITASTLLLKFVKSAKAQKALSTILKIGEAAQGYIQQAEDFANYSGAEKKEFVMTKANQYAIANGLEFDSTAASDKIEELVKLTKAVNQREKDIKNEKENETL